jgi:hypothetical protein
MLISDTDIHRSFSPQERRIQEKVGKLSVPTNAREQIEMLKREGGFCHLSARGIVYGPEFVELSYIEKEKEL